MAELLANLFTYIVFFIIYYNNKKMLSSQKDIMNESFEQ